jgi:Thrombospondin type 3 repeat
MFKTIIITTCTFTILLAGLVANAKMFDDQYSTKFDTSKFQKVGDVELPNKIKLPTVFKLDKEKVTGNKRDGLIIVDQSDKPAEMFTRFENSEVKTSQTIIKALSPTKQFDGFMSDAFPNTFTEFDLDKDGGIAKIVLDFGETRLLEGLDLGLSENVNKPDMIEILGENLGSTFTVLAKTNYDTFLKNFPPIKASKITINLFHSQVLRISEISPQFGWGISKEQAQNEWFFLAIPGNNYKALVNENDRFPKGWKTLDLNLGYEITEASVSELRSNSAFINKDTDSDGVKDLQDNCPLIPNPDQIDKDLNSKGDACEDRDLDQIIDAQDNCSNNSNFDQKDKDKDGLGDTCDNIDNRFLETNSWILPVAMTFCSVVVIAVFATRLKKIGN